MATVIYEIPNSVKEMFEQGENSYRIIDYSIQGMDNIQSMQFFLDCIGATRDNIETDDGTQVVIIHPNFDHKLVIDRFWFDCDSKYLKNVVPFTK